MTDHREMNQAPIEFQNWLAEIGGRNRYDDPIFRVWWDQYGHGDGIYRCGGVWSVNEQFTLGYRDLLKGDGSGCWCLGMWHDALEFGTPESYYARNLDPDTGLQILGEYPYSGRVELLYSLRYFERLDDRLQTYRMPLNYQTFERLIPILLRAKDISWEKTRAAHQELLKQEEDAKLVGIEAHLKDNAVSQGAVSFTKQGIRSTMIDRKMIEMQRAWNDL